MTSASRPVATLWFAAFAVLLSVSLLGVPATASEPGCSQDQLREGTCEITAGLGNGSVDLGGSQTTPGSGGNGGAATGTGSGTPTAPVEDTCDEVVLEDRCFGVGPGRTDPVEPPTQPVTLADIASFRPDPGIDTMEPNGWMVVGLDTNFVASGGRHVKDGSLLGQPASVRFTPVAWHWTYGDGTSRTAATPGATWAAQSMREFSPTSTSHVFTAAGTYYIDLTIDFRAEYRFAGTGWIPISGILSLPANRLVATAGDAKTVLVERVCTENPAGPGC